MRERSKYDGTLTTKGFLEYDLLSQKPKDMEVKENIFGVGIGFTVNDTRKFGFHETPDKENIYNEKIWTEAGVKNRQNFRNDGLQ